MPAKRDTTKRPWRDPDDAPALTKAWFDQADLYEAGRLVRRGRPKGSGQKVQTTLRLDADIVAAYRASGPGWQTRLNEALRATLPARGTQSPRNPATGLAMNLDDVLARLKAARPELQEFPIRSLSVFGSVARHEATASSDVDLLVEFSAPVGLLCLVRLKRTLERILGARVDLTTPGALRPDSRDRILKDAVRAA